MEKLTKLAIVLNIIAISIWLAIFGFLIPDKPVDTTIFYVQQ